MRATSASSTIASVHLGAVGLELGTGSQQTLVKGSTFTDIGSSAVRLSGIARADHDPDGPAQTSSANTISGNLISDVGLGIPGRAGNLHRVLERHQGVRNTVENVPWSGIALGWGWGLLDPGGFPGLPGAKQYQWGNWPKPTPQPKQRRGRQHDPRVPRPALGRRGDLHDRLPGDESRERPADQEQHRLRQAHRGRAPTPSTPTAAAATSRSGETPPTTTRSGRSTLGRRPVTATRCPTPTIPSAANGLPYGSDIGGCRTYGDISYSELMVPGTDETDMQLGKHRLRPDLA